MSKCRIFVVTPIGGLGNQIFQLLFYRWLRSLHKRSFLLLPTAQEVPGPSSRVCQLQMIHNDSLTLSGTLPNQIRKYGLSRLGRLCTAGRVRRLDLTQVLTWSDATNQISSAPPFSVSFISGYFQFSDVLSHAALWQDLIFTDNYAPTDNIASSPNWPELPNFDQDCVIHVRRGDYVGVGFPVLTEHYYTSAVEILMAHGFSGRLFVMTDTPSFLGSLSFPMPHYLLEVSDPLVSLQVFSRFRYKVIANSTFSFWGALLSSRQANVVYPTVWPHLEAEFAKMCKRSGWICNRVP